MKKYFKLLLVAVLFIGVVALTGCEKKKEETKDPIIGSWKYDSGADFTYTFKEDGTLTYEGYGSVMEGTYKIEGNKISILYNGNTVPFETTYTIDGDTLNIKDSFDEDTIYKKVK